MNKEPTNPGDVVGYIHHTESFGAVDGPGIRFVIFLQGCNLRCLYCHNPDSVACGGGEAMTAQAAADLVLRYRNFIRDGGVTFSGGEPLLQPEFVAATSRLLHEHGLHVAIDTAGQVPLDKSRIAIDAADLLLLDIKAMDQQVGRELTGRDNTGAFATLDYCEETHKPVWIRHVLVPGYTLDNEQLAALAQRLTAYSCVEQIEILPFHKLGEPKWEEIGREYKLADTPATTQEEAEAARDIFRRRGFKVL